jgi:hypothetical protein
MRQRSLALRTALERVWQERLHSAPLLQCRCGEILNSARCACPFPTDHHAPETMQERCNVCCPEWEKEP